jgi:hypothetical protein
MFQVGLNVMVDKMWVDVTSRHRISWGRIIGTGQLEQVGLKSQPGQVRLDRQQNQDGQNTEVGKVTLISNGDEALNDEFLLKSNGDEALNDVFLLKLTAIKRLTLRRNHSDEAFNDA